MSDLFLRACRGEKVERAPIWIMRQAGRYLPEYRKVREKADFITLCKTPELAAKVTMQPIDRFGLDAAILFSDILTPAEPMGFGLEFNPGPLIDPPVRCAADVERIRLTDPREGLPYVFETIRILRRELEGKAPLIGFAAAPFTLATYLVEGSGSKNFDQIKRLIFGDPQTAQKLLDKVSEMTIAYLSAQIEAGAQAVQLFDTWGGLLAPPEFEEFALRHARRVIDGLADAGVPRIYFALNGGHLMEQIRQCGAEVVGQDWRMPLHEASRRLGDQFVLQGNLDPCVLFASGEVVEREARRVLDEGSKIPGHIFNLGHGVLPKTPVENVETLIRTVQGSSRG